MEKYITEAFTNTENGLNGELNNLTLKCLNSKDNNFNLDCEENLIVNSITTKVSTPSLEGLTFDEIYPVGSYYETSNTDFNPNVSWGGSWVLDTAGRVTVAYDSTQEEFDIIGKLGGNKNLQKHHHDIRYARPEGSGVTISCTGEGLEALNITNWQWQKNNSNEFNSSSNLSTNYAGIGNSGNLQPYIVVNRWHRIA